MDDYPVIIRKRYCKRYVPTPPNASILEFLKDRYRNIPRPEGPFCHCGLLKSEHLEEAIATDSPDVNSRRQSSREEKQGQRSKKHSVKSNVDFFTLAKYYEDASKWQEEVDTDVRPTDVRYDSRKSHIHVCILIDKINFTFNCIFSLIHANFISYI